MLHTYLIKKNIWYWFVSDFTFFQKVIHCRVQFLSMVLKDRDHIKDKLSFLWDFYIHVKNLPNPSMQILTKSDLWCSVNQVNQQFLTEWNLLNSLLTLILSNLPIALFANEILPVVPLIWEIHAVCEECSKMSCCYATSVSPIHHLGCSMFLPAKLVKRSCLEWDRSWVRALVGSNQFFKDYKLVFTVSSPFSMKPK